MGSGLDMGPRAKRAVFAFAGTLSLGLALIGLVVPVLPTTPFLLLAAACYARSSERLHRWLLGQRTLGPMIRQWQETRSMAPAVKRRALLIVAITFAISIVLVGDTLLRVLLAVIGAVVALGLSRVRTTA